MQKWLLALLVVSAGCFGYFEDAEPEPAAGESFLLLATECTELLVQVPVDDGHARSQIPDSYTPLIVNGEAVAIVGLKKCADTMLGNLSIGPSSTGDVGILLDSGQVDTTFVYYQTHWFTNNTILATVLEGQGWNVMRTGAEEFLDGRVGPTGMGPVSYVVANEAGMYRAEGNVVSQAVPGDLVARGLYDGVFGTVVVDKVLSNTVTGVGEASVNANGAVGQLLGNSDGQGSAMFGVYSMSGTVGLAVE